MEKEPSSFRDRTNQVFYADAKIYRALNHQAFSTWQTLKSKDFFQRLLKERKLVATDEVAPPQSAQAQQNTWAGFLTHERVPFISYPYEWSFGMLKAAALLHLELMDLVLRNNFILKDASSFNVQWFGARPVFIDIASFEQHQTGEPWRAYTQFCQMFLYPLMLQAYRGVPFQSMLRGAIEGIDPLDMCGLLSVRDFFRPGVFGHVYLHSKLHKLTADKRQVKSQVEKSGFHTELILANLKKLRRIIERLEAPRAKSIWTQYEQKLPYTDLDREMKERFVLEVAESRPWSLVWDIGCNTGRFSRILAPRSKYVLALDSDSRVIDQLYKEESQKKNEKILPLVFDLANPSPGLGWRGKERSPLENRGKPDLVLMLALLHHLVISRHLSLEEIMKWARDISSPLVLEFVSREDPMVQILLAGKKETYPEYSLENFKTILKKFFRIEKELALPSGTRSLFFVM